MQWKLFLQIAGVGVAALCLYAQTAETPGVPKPALVNEAQGVPPRAAPTDYPAKTKLGTFTLAADFAGHTVPAPEGLLGTEDYVTVEIAFYGPAGSRLELSQSDFSLRINSKKTPLPSLPFERVGQNARDPEWAPPEKPEKPKTSIGGGGGDTAPAPVKPPPELQRAWFQRVRRAALPEGDRPLPRAGLLYFPYGGKEKGIRSLELIYSGAAGKATLDLQP